MPSWINLTAPSAGDPTEVDLMEDVINNLAFLYNQFLSVVGTREVVLNGSFESDADGDTYPDGWTRTLYTGGSFTYNESVSAADGLALHGKRSISFTSPGGGGNGGGYITSENFMEVTEAFPYRIQFSTKSTAIGIHNKAEIKWYDSTQTLISTEILHEDSSTNPSAWTVYHSVVTPPANARYAKLLFYGAVDDDTTAGTCFYDDIRMSIFVFRERVRYAAAGTFYWKPPAGIYAVYAVVVGGGGGGGGNSGASSACAGGGSGGMCRGTVQVTPGTLSTVVVGAGGAGAGSGTGSAGGNSTFGGMTAGGGGGGAQLGGAGGAGGTATGGEDNTTGNAGSSRVDANIGGDGGHSVWSGDYGRGGPNTSAGGNADNSGGAGGGEGANSGGSGGNGAPGLVILFW